MKGWRAAFGVVGVPDPRLEVLARIFSSERIVPATVSFVDIAGIVKGARHADLAKAFIEFMLTPAFQSELPLTQWMYPVNSTVKLPASYAAAPKPAKVLKADPAALEKALAQWADVAAK